MKQESGFILPNMMVIVFFCLLIVAHISMTLISDKKFYEETKQYYVLDNLMKVGVEKSLQDIKDGSLMLNEETTLNTTNGKISYRVQELSPMIYEVSITCETLQNKTYKASFQIDLTKNEMIVWSEY